MLKLIKLLNKMVIHGPTHLETLDHNLILYLLRCNPVLEEDCTNSVIIYEPANPSPVKQKLPPYPEGRRAIADTWLKRTKKTSYASFYFGLENETIDYEYIDTFPTTPDEMEKIASVALDFCKRRLPDHKIFAVVAHIDQISCVKDDVLSINAPHIHIIMEETQK